MVPPTLVRADEGKNGDEGPAPSSSMVEGALSGFTMRSDGEGLAPRPSQAPAGTTTSSAVANM
jgi:hypothetical protein